MKYQERKTVKEWFESVNDPKLSRTLIRRSKDCRRNNLHFKKPNLHRALGSAFIWGNTPEGGSYWQDMFYEFKENPNEYLGNKHLTAISKHYEI